MHHLYEYPGIHMHCWYHCLNSNLWNIYWTIITMSHREENISRYLKWSSTMALIGRLCITNINSPDARCAPRWKKKKYKFFQKTATLFVFDPIIFSSQKFWWLSKRLEVAAYKTYRLQSRKEPMRKISNSVYTYTHTDTETKPGASDQASRIYFTLLI